MKEPPKPKELPEATFADVLVAPPSTTGYRVPDFFGKQKYMNVGGQLLPVGKEVSLAVHAPTIELHCSSATCHGPRFFRCADSPVYQASPGDRTTSLFVTYRCSNCNSSTKEFALKAHWSSIGPQRKVPDYAVVQKLGELPAYGPPTPNRLRKLLDETNLDLFLKGRRCESQSLGIGAFGYYRRVVEQQKNEMIDAILRVARKLGSHPDVINDLESAKKEQQFSKAVEQIKHGVPQALLVQGQNPLTLLHSALSEGLHNETDDNCLEMAIAIRLVMVDFAERLTSALQDQQELSAALQRLARRPTRAGQNTGTDEPPEEKPKTDQTDGLNG